MAMKPLNSLYVPVFDRCVAILLLVCTSAIWLPAIFLIHSTAGRPIFVTDQARAADGESANRLRFRTSLRSSNPAFRIISGFLQKYSIHELPSLWTVVRGEMKLKDMMPHLVDW